MTSQCLEALVIQLSMALRERAKSAHLLTAVLGAFELRLLRFHVASASLRRSSKPSIRPSRGDMSHLSYCFDRGVGIDTFIDSLLTGVMLSRYGFLPADVYFPTCESLQRSVASRFLGATLPQEEVEQCLNTSLPHRHEPACDELPHIHKEALDNAQDKHTVDLCQWQVIANTFVLYGLAGDLLLDPLCVEQPEQAPLFR
ncbi:hypothetical protein EDB80DRAFT_883428 [Ilyonectria destructans]|nr:hypothetical protein EDB80DRAFT_883428 [Ilyonectria destructans]